MRLYAERIIKVYSKNNSILYDELSGKENILLKSKNLKFEIIDVSSDNQWVVILLRPPYPSTSIIMAFYNIPKKLFVNLLPPRITKEEVKIDSDKKGEYLSYNEPFADKARFKKYFKGEYSKLVHMVEIKDEFDIITMNRKIYLKDLEKIIHLFKESAQSSIID